MVFVTPLIWFATAIVVVGTLMPFSNSVRWWVRAWEFPRKHIAAIGVATLIAILVAPVTFGLWLASAMLVCSAYQIYQIYPYTSFATTEVTLIDDAPKDSQIKFLAANVLMENTRKADLINIIDREDPDVLLLMETDQGWLDALKDCLSRYTTVVAHPLDNYYGIIFATRLKTQNAEVVFLSNDNTPSIRAELFGPDGTGFNFTGLHPKPPVPGTDSKRRDEEIKKAAKMAGNADWPTVCMGDFNDVAWSWTTKRFKRYGGFLEPRIGRGTFSTFHAQYPLISLPIDQLYITAGIGLVSFSRLEEFGSDHFPVSAVISFHNETQAD
ncbi:MAG: endonuclease/exonuclease/phosphatase family protein [Octadecabacter sp.]